MTIRVGERLGWVQYRHLHISFMGGTYSQVQEYKYLSHHQKGAADCTNCTCCRTASAWQQGPGQSGLRLSTQMTPYQDLGALVSS